MWETVGGGEALGAGLRGLYHDSHRLYIQGACSPALCGWQNQLPLFFDGISMLE